MPITNFAAALTPTGVEGESLCFLLSEDWLQGRSSFGGLQAALALVAMRRLVPAEVTLRVLQTTFVGPVPPGELRVSARLLRAGKNVSHVEARIEVDGSTACLLVGVFGAARTSAVAVAMQPVSAPKPPESSTPFPHIEGLTPSFLRHFSMRWAEGTVPFTGSSASATRIWLQHREPSGNAEADLVALADVIPSPAISMMKKFAPASSLTWTLELLEPAPAQGEGWWRADTEIHSARDGYVAQTSRLHASDNRVVALARQAVVVFG